MTETTTTLREEIFTEITKISKNLKSEQDHIVADKIISIFTKLIDEKIKVLEKQRKDIEKTHSDDLQCNGITGQHLMIVGSVVELSKLKEELQK